MVLLLRFIHTFREDVFNVRDPFLLAVSMSLQHDMFMILFNLEAATAVTQFKAFTCVAFRINLIFISSCLLHSNCKIFVTFAIRPNKGVKGSLRAPLVATQRHGLLGYFRIESWNGLTRETFACISA